MQRRVHSLIESVVNVGIGYLVAIGSQFVIYPFFGIELSLADNLTIGAFFTVISIGRSYVVRRWFTRRTE